LSAPASLDIDSFLSEHWQREPLLIRGAIPAFIDPLSPEELAGLSLEDDVESRIVVRTEETWHLRNGPFQSDSFTFTSPWTLLVQGVDIQVPAVADLRQLVDFLPGWRLDDVMVSYASDGGSVGPHYDNYDVFLFQGLGRRRWQLGQRCDGSEPLQASDGLRILAEFAPSAEYLLEPGDMLYLPPGLAHWGTAEGDCMTYSIGFRAPRINDLLSRWLDTVLENIDPELLYRDPLPMGRAVPGEIAAPGYRSALSQIQETIARTAVSPDWFGELLTEQVCEASVDTTVIHAGHSIRIPPAARVAWRQENGSMVIYANGEALRIAGAASEQRELLGRLCRGEIIELSTRDVEFTWLEGLAERGCLENG
jgi:50S ribosomal protein L16 3-hydroxylase